MARLTQPPRLVLRWKHSVADHVVALAWSPDGGTVAAAGAGGPAVLFDAATGHVRRTLAGHGFGTAHVAWRPDGKRLATTGQDGKARLWDASTGTETAILDVGAAWGERVAFGPRGDFLVTAAGKKLKLWSGDGEHVRDYPDAASSVADVVWSLRGKEFYAAGYGGAEAYRPDAAEAGTRYEWNGSVLKLALSPDGKRLAGSAQDASIHFWFTKSGDDLEMSGYPMKVRELAWDAESRFLATGGGPTAVVWDCAGKGPAKTKPIMLERHEKPLADLAFQSRGPVLASACKAGLVCLWYPEGSTRVQAEADLGEEATHATWSPRDAYVAASGADGAVAVYAV